MFGLSWWRNGSILIGTTRDDANPVVAFAREGGELRRLDVRCERFINGRRFHGAAVDDAHLFAVAAQGDPDSAVCSNTDRWSGHHVGKVLISRLRLENGTLVVSDTEIWNPYNCDHHHHVNDIIVDGEWIYLCSFSTCDGAKRYIDRGAVARFRTSDRTFDRILTDALHRPHSPQLHGGRLFVCSSDDSTVVSVPAGELYAAPRLEYKGINNFVRGLTVTDEYLFVGLSRSAGRTESDRFTEPINGVLRFERATGRTERLELPDLCANVYTVVRV